MKQTPKAGQTNQAMSYCNPPTEEEINRNANRWKYNRNYDQPSSVNAQGEKMKKEYLEE